MEKIQSRLVIFLWRFLLSVLPLILLTGCFMCYDWSPDGKLLVVPDNNVLYIVTPEDRTAKAVHMEKRKNYHVGHARFLDNDNVLFFSYLSSRSRSEEEKKLPLELRILNLKTREVRTLADIDVSHTSSDKIPLWASFTVSPDRKHVVFVRRDGKEKGRTRLMRLDLSTGKILDMNVQAANPRYSPDGNMISAYGRPVDIKEERNANVKLLLLAPDGNVIRERSGDGFNMWFCETIWEADSKGFFTCNDAEQVVRVSADDLSMKTLLEAGEGESFMMLQNDPRGEHLYVSSRNWMQYTKIIKYSLRDGGEEEVFSQVYKDNANVIPAESPDGRWMALNMYTEAGHDKNGLYLGVYSMQNYKPIDLTVKKPDGTVVKMEGIEAMAFQVKTPDVKVDDSPEEFPPIGREKIDAITMEADAVSVWSKKDDYVVLNVEIPPFPNWKVSPAVLRVESIIDKTGDIFNREREEHLVRHGRKLHSFWDRGIDSTLMVSVKPYNKEEAVTASGMLQVDIPLKVRAHSFDLSGDEPAAEVKIAGEKAYFFVDGLKIKAEMPVSLFKKIEVRALDGGGNYVKIQGYGYNSKEDHVTLDMDVNKPVSRIEVLEAVDTVTKELKFSVSK